MDTEHRDVAMGRLHTPTSPSSGPLPGVVLIHDVWGPSAHSQALAADLASSGFAVLEIDLYRDLGEFEIEAPGAFIQSLSDTRILEDLDVGADWLAAQDGVGGKIGVMGVCMGGTFALLAACRSDLFAAAAPFYGILSYDTGMLANPEGRDFELKPTAPLEAASALKMPLLAAFGADDDFVPAADVRALEEKLQQSGQSFVVDVYSDAGHAFLNRTREEAYRPEASAAAWAKLIPFLRRSLAD